MKRFAITAIITLIIMACAISASAAEFRSAYQVGSFMTEGSTSRTAHFLGGDIILKTMGEFTLKQRVGMFTVRGQYPEIQGEMTATIMQLMLSQSLWELYIAQKTGLFNQTLQGDDKVHALIGLEVGCSPFYKPLELSVGADLMPVDDRGDRVFLYAGLNLKI